MSRSTTVPAGGARRDRTDDLLLAKQALSQLSYGPGPERTHPAARNSGRGRALVGLGRLELPTSRLSSARSNQLSYKPEHGPTDRPPRSVERLRQRGLVREEREMKTAVSRLWGPDRPLLFPRDPIEDA